MNSYRVRVDNTSLPTFSILISFSIFYWLLDINIYFIQKAVPIITLLLIGSFLNVLLHKKFTMSILEFVSFSISLAVLYTMVLGIISFMVAPILFGNVNVELLIIILLYSTLVFLSIIVQNSETCAEIESKAGKKSIILTLVPIIVVSATRLLYTAGVRVPVLLLFILLSVVPIIAISDPGFPLPAAIASMAGSLLLHNSTYGLYIRPTDNIVEYNLILDILNANSWISSITIGMNGMPGSVLILPTVSVLTGLQPVTLYKYLTPIISLVIPLILFYSYTNLVSRYTSFFAAVWFFSIFNFFAWSSTTMKMVSSGVFVSLLVYSVTAERFDSDFSKRILMISSFFGVALSHYGTTYILLISIVGTTLFMVIIESISGRNVIVNAIPEFEPVNRFSNVSVVIFGTGALSWYIYLTSSSNLRSFAATIVSFLQWLTSSPSVGSSGTVGNQILFGNFSISLSLLRGVYFISFALMISGILSRILINFRKRSIDEFTVLSGFISLLIPLPYILKIGQYSGGRIWLIPAYFSSFYIFLGIYWAIEKIKLGRIGLDRHQLSALFLTIFILLNTGVAADVIFEENRTASIYLSEPRIANNGTVEEKEYLDRSLLHNLDVVGSKWSVQYLSSDSPVWVDQNADNSLRFAGFTRARQHHDYGTRNIYYIDQRDVDEINSYVFLSTFNTATGHLRVSGGINSKFLQKRALNLDKRSKLYSNGGSTLYV